MIVLGTEMLTNGDFADGGTGWDYSDTFTFDSNKAIISAVAPEMVTNGDFDSDSDWILEDPFWQIVGGKLVFVDADEALTGGAQQDIGITVEHGYLVSLDYNMLAGGNIGVRGFVDLLENSDVILEGGAGQGSLSQRCRGNDFFTGIHFLNDFVADPSNGWIDNVSVKKLPYLAQSGIDSGYTPDVDERVRFRVKFTLEGVGRMQVIASCQGVDKVKTYTTEAGLVSFDLFVTGAGKELVVNLQFIGYEDFVGNISDVSVRRVIENQSLVALPVYAQKTLYKNAILFVAKGQLYVAGAVTADLPFALSQIASPTYPEDIRALAAPFGTPMVSSAFSETPPTYSATIVEMFDGRTRDSLWKSLVIPLMEGKHKGFIDYIVVRTAPLPNGAKANLKFEVNQATDETISGIVQGDDKTRHVFELHKECEDLRLYIDYGPGSTFEEEECLIKSVWLIGHIK